MKRGAFKQTCTSWCINRAIVPPPAASSFAGSSAGEFFLFFLPLLHSTFGPPMYVAPGASSQGPTQLKALEARLHSEAVICPPSLDVLVIFEENNNNNKFWNVQVLIVY